jgi:outer membrane protein OmpA-like peptidoglycan-associated protein
VYHTLEGGAIAQARQPPPGINAPYPNLADVPPEPKQLAPGAEAEIAQQAHRASPGVSAPSPEALAGLALPSAPPPLPNIPGIRLPAKPSTAPPPLPAPPPAPPPTSAPVALAFPHGSAVLPEADVTALQAVARDHGRSSILVGGFGDGSLDLALARARRLADALTAQGVPPAIIRITAMAAGSGGFVQLVY